VSDPGCVIVLKWKKTAGLLMATTFHWGLELQPGQFAIFYDLEIGNGLYTE